MASQQPTAGSQIGAPETTPTKENCNDEVKGCLGYPTAFLGPQDVVAVHFGAFQLSAVC